MKTLPWGFRAPIGGPVASTAPVLLSSSSGNVTPNLSMGWGGVRGTQQPRGLSVCPSMVCVQGACGKEEVGRGHSCCQKPGLVALCLYSDLGLEDRRE